MRHPGQVLDRPRQAGNRLTAQGEFPGNSSTSRDWTIRTPRAAASHVHHTERTIMRTEVARPATGVARRGRWVGMASRPSAERYGRAPHGPARSARSSPASRSSTASSSAHQLRCSPRLSSRRLSLVGATIAVISLVIGCCSLGRSTLGRLVHRQRHAHREAPAEDAGERAHAASGRVDPARLLIAEIQKTPRRWRIPSLFAAFARALGGEPVGERRIVLGIRCVRDSVRGDVVDRRARARSRRSRCIVRRQLDQPPARILNVDLGAGSRAPRS